MTIIEMAKEAGLDKEICIMNPKELKAFAELIRAEERAKLEKEISILKSHGEIQRQLRIKNETKTIKS